MKSNTRKNNPFITLIKSFFFYDSNERFLFYESFSTKYDVQYFKRQYNKKKLVLFSPNELKFNNLIHFKTTRKEFVENYGKPIYTKSYESNPKITSLVYKTKIAGVGCKCNLIFHKSKLILFNYVFTEFTKKEKKHC